MASTLRNPDKLEQRLQQKHGLPWDWRIFKLESVPADNPTQVLVTGAIARAFKQGKRKGQTTWNRPLQFQRSFLLSSNEFEKAFERG